jgi:thiol-disulfide isomerase/thioredoxin
MNVFKQDLFMKKKLLCAVIMLLLLHQSFAQTLSSGKEYVIKGRIKGVSSGKVKLMQPNLFDRTSKIIDSGVVKNGMFELKGRISGPQMMVLNVEPGNWNLNVFVEHATVNIAVDTTGAQHYDYAAQGYGKGANIKEMIETGSKNYDDLMAYQNDPGQNQYADISAKLNEKFKAAANDIDALYKVRDEMASVKKQLQIWQKARIDAYVNQSPSSVAGVCMFYNLYEYSSDMPFATLNSMLNRFTGEAKASGYYQKLEYALHRLKAVQVGSIAPDFTLLKRDSTKFTLSSLRGKYTMIDFWASWCHPCRQAIPHWKEVYQKYHDKGFEILSVSDDVKWKDWKTAMDIEKMHWTQVCDEFPVKRMPARIASLYMSTYIPFYVLLDKEGKILVSSGDENKIDEKLKEIFQM